MEVAIRKFAVGHCVYGKIKGYPPWPGIITELQKTKAKVVYFNWQNQFNWIGLKKIMPITSAAKINEKNYHRNQHFKRAVDEMNHVIGSIVDERRVKSGKQPDLKEKNSVNPVIYLKLLSKDEIQSIKDGLKKKNKRILRDRKRK